VDRKNVEKRNQKSTCKKSSNHKRLSTERGEVILRGGSKKKEKVPKGIVEKKRPVSCEVENQASA